MKGQIVVFVLLATMAVGCDGADGGYHNFFDIPFGYDQEVSINLVTPDGIQVDTSGYEIDAALLDKRVGKIEACILRVMAENPIPDSAWQCIPANYKPGPLKRGYFTIKLVKPVIGCTSWQLLPIPAPDELCVDKGLPPDQHCPCMWRTAIQDENIILSPPPETRPDIQPTSIPAPYLWEIGRMMTSCNGIWLSPFSKCLSY